MHGLEIQIPWGDIFRQVWLFTSLTFTLDSEYQYVLWVYKTGVLVYLGVGPAFPLGRKGSSLHGPSPKSVLLTSERIYRASVLRTFLFQLCILLYT